MSEKSKNDELEFNRLIPELRPAPEVHPESTMDFDEHELSFKPTRAIEEITYHELAWEFLRRNRFYQTLYDKAEGHIDAHHWGFRWHKNAPRSHGLIRLKSFHEAYNEGAPPAWEGLDGFAESLPTDPVENFKTVQIQLKPGQVVVVYDLAGIVGGDSPYRAQAWATEDRLQELRTSMTTHKDFHGKCRDKSVLLRQLHLFDKLSAGKTIDSAAATLDYSITERYTPKARGHNHVPFRTSPPRASSTVFKDAKAAYELVYRHGYLRLLTFERGYELRGKRLAPLEYLDEQENA